MKTVSNSKILLSNTIETKEMPRNHGLSTQKKTDRNLAHEVGVFSHHRDVKVAVEELQEAGFGLSKITLIARRWRSDWSSDLTISDRFDEESFGTNEAARNFFQKLFKRGKYLLLLTGRENEMNAAGAIMGRRQAHAKVWQF